MRDLSEGDAKEIKNTKHFQEFILKFPSSPRRPPPTASRDPDTPHAPDPSHRGQLFIRDFEGSAPPWRPDPTRDLRELILLAKFPFASLSPRSKPIEHRFVMRETFFTLIVSPIDPAIGLATVSDLDVLVVVATYLTHAHNNNLDPPPRLSLRAAEILTTLNRPHGGDQHRRLYATLARLRNTAVSLEASRPTDAGEFRLLEGVDPPSGTGRLTLRVPHWIRRQVSADAIMRINPDALQLHGLERRLYSWARALLGANRPSFDITLHRAHARAASRQDLRKFRAAIAEIARRDRIPDFHVGLVAKEKQQMLRLTRREPVWQRPEPLVIEVPDFTPPDLPMVGYEPEAETVEDMDTFFEDDDAAD